MLYCLGKNSRKKVCACSPQLYIVHVSNSVTFFSDFLIFFWLNSWMPNPWIWRANFVYCVGIQYIHSIVQLLPWSSSKTFSSSHMKTPYPLSSHSPYMSHPSPWQSSVYFQSLCICLFWIFHILIHEIKQYVTFCVWLCPASFTQLNVFKVHQCSMYQNFILFFLRFCWGTGGGEHT